jgi:GAF domain-containing protein
MDWLASTSVYRTGRTARKEVTAEQITDRGTLADAVRAMGFFSTVSAPIVVEGDLWGVVTASSSQESLPADTERRIESFSELVATAIANAESRGELATSEARARALAEEQAALRRVATLVARAPASSELFSTVAREVATVLNVPGVIVDRFETDGTNVTLGAAYDPDLAGAESFFGSGTRMPLDPGSLAAQVFESHRPARVRDYSQLPGTIGDAARAAGLGSGVAGPILVDGELWGQMCVFSRAGATLPVGTEDRVREFVELVATAISNYEAHAALQRLADEQAALRRVATLVAEDVPPSQLFRAVTHEVGVLLGADFSGMARFEDDVVITMATWAAEGEHPRVPEPWPIEPGDPAATILETRGPVRWDDWAQVPGASAAYIRDEVCVRSSVAAPVVVGGRIWGVLAVHSKQSLPQGSESRLAQFSDLVATAVANAESRAEVDRLANEQAALRRVATLVAREASPADVFAKVAAEAADVLGTAECTLLRDDGDGTASVVATSDGAISGGFPVGSRVPADGDGVVASVLRAGRPYRIDDYSAAGGALADGARDRGIGSAVGCPILVRSRIWGVLVVAMPRDPCPPDTERHLAQFADLVATAIANAEARAEVIRLADEQAALRRVATLVAGGVDPAVLFAAVSGEVCRLLGAEQAAVGRFEPDGRGLVVVGASEGYNGPLGTRVELADYLSSTEVYRTGRPARKDLRAEQVIGSGPVADVLRSWGFFSAVSAPILVEGSLWGVLNVLSGGEPLPPDTEQRLGKFAELVATAIANTESRSQLSASRRRIVAASDEARRRIERDLHDGTQQRLVSLGLAVRAAEANIPSDRDDLRSELRAIATGLGDAVQELQELSRGIHPAILAEGGLGAALRTLGRRSAVPVELHLSMDTRLPPAIEVAAYYVVSEALANAAKHAHASRIEVSLARRGNLLVLSIRDDGVGGADPVSGTGLVGMSDRLEALGGSVRVESPPGEGTLITAELPL